MSTINFGLDPFTITDYHQTGQDIEKALKLWSDLQKAFYKLNPHQEFTARFYLAKVKNVKKLTLVVSITFTPKSELPQTISASRTFYFDYLTDEIIGTQLVHINSETELEKIANDYFFDLEAVMRLKYSELENAILKIFNRKF